MDGDQTPLEHILTKHKHFIKLRVPEKELQAVELTIDGMEVNANAIYLVHKNELGKQIKTFQDADFYLTSLMRRTIIVSVSKTTPSPPQPPKLAVALNFPPNMVKSNWPQHALHNQDKVPGARSPMPTQDLHKTPAHKTPSSTSYEHMSDSHHESCYSPPDTFSDFERTLLFRCPDLAVLPDWQGKCGKCGCQGHIAKTCKYRPKVCIICHSHEHKHIETCPSKHLPMHQWKCQQSVQGTKGQRLRERPVKA